jgi:hypothetical protein
LILSATPTAVAARHNGIGKLVFTGGHAQSLKGNQVVETTPGRPNKGPSHSTPGRCDLDNRSELQPELIALFTGLGSEIFLLSLIFQKYNKIASLTLTINNHCY